MKFEGVDLIFLPRKRCHGRNFVKTALNTKVP